MRTRNGRVITDADLDRMAAEAEAGYDLSTWKRRPGRPSLSAQNTSAHSPRITTRVPEELRARVASRASAEGRSVSAVMRHLLEDYAGGGSAAPKSPHRG
ncbi:MAG: Arc family DNA-binding protein [Candidatus Limnocylindrales bacterium]